jgi:hypothetical protein
MASLGLDALLQAAGASLGDAQGQLMTGINAPPTVMAIAEATLEMKLTVDSAQAGVLRVAPVSAADARTGAIDVGALSSVTMRFVAFGNDVPGQIGTATPAPSGGSTTGTPPDRPVKTPLSREDAIAALRARADIARRVAAGERIKFDAVPTGTGEGSAWIVTARRADGDAVAAAQFAAKV